MTRANKIIDCIKFVIYGEDEWRVFARTLKTGELVVTYDAHGQSVAEARKSIQNIVRSITMPATLRIIHGYNHGTAIKEMIMSEDFYGRAIKKTCLVSNKGETIISLSE